MRRILFGLLLVCLPLVAGADLLAGTAGNISVGSIPQYPTPGQNVTLTVVNNTGSADTATYTWTVDGKTALQGIGAKTLTLAAGVLGSTEEISVDAEVNAVSVGNATVFIRPAEVDLVWEAQTSAPPLYIGRPLPNGASTVKVLAVPHLFSDGGEVPPEALIYTWKENDSVIANRSGYGKSSVTLTPASFNQPFAVSVHVETRDGTAAVEGSTVIQPQNPKIIVYENAPLLGVRFDAVMSGVIPFPVQEISFMAFPLFVSTFAPLSYSWTLDGSPFAVNPQKPRDVTFRKVGDAAQGTHAITVSFQNPNEFLENGSSSFKLTF